ncbi:MAG: UDP-3-O-(3-hydroxymyristoyl)glucosamine N-acyltransferase [Phycisphaeraceae bacterium]
MPSFTTSQIAQHVRGELIGPGDLAISGAETLDRAQPGHLTFIGDKRYLPAWEASKAAAALIVATITAQPGEGRALIQVTDADLAMALVLDLFASPPVRPKAGVHPSAVVDPSAILGQNVAIGAHCTVGAKVRLGDDVVLHANVVLMDQVEIGAASEIFPGVVIRERCVLGQRCVLHPNVVIGADGFGYRPSLDPAKPGLVKITHIGNVEIGNDVEIGACTTIDRAKFSSTLVGDGTKIDNQVQIGHNCRIGRHCVLCGQVGLAGSITVGDGAMMGGKAGLRDHINIGAGARLAAYAAVISDVPAGESWGGYPAMEMREAGRIVMAMRKLPDFMRDIKKKLR